MKTTILFCNLTCTAAIFRIRAYIQNRTLSKYSSPNYAYWDSQFIYRYRVTHKGSEKTYGVYTVCYIILMVPCNSCLFLCQIIKMSHFKDNFQDVDN